MINILGLDERTEFFYSKYSEYFFNKNSNKNEFDRNNKYLTYALDNGFMNLITRILKEFKNQKLFENKFYLLTNLFNLILKVFITGNHSKLSNLSKNKLINELVELINREKYSDLINDNSTLEKDTKKFIDLLVENINKSLDNNQNLLTAIPKLGNLLKQINLTSKIFSTKKSIKSSTIVTGFNLEGRNSLNIKDIGNNTINNDKMIYKLIQIENKISNIEKHILDKFNQTMIEKRVEELNAFSPRRKKSIIYLIFRFTNFRKRKFFYRI